MNNLDNLDIRVCVSESGLLYKDIAMQMGISPEYLSRSMRRPLKPDMRSKILKAVRELRGDGD